MDIFSQFKNKWFNIVNKANKFGVAIPMFRDPKTGTSSVSLTMLVISFNLVLAGIIGKYSKMLDGVDVSQALNLFYGCSALYFGRKMSRDEKGTVSVGDKSDIDTTK